MEVKMLSTRITGFIKKNKYIVLIIILGFVFMLFPTNKQKKATSEVSVAKSPEQVTEISMEEKLSAILKRIEGAGNVEVMLTIAEGEEVVYQTNDTITMDNESSDRSTDTIIIADVDKKQTGLVRQKNPPAYLGAIIVCQGADNPIVKLAITEAVSRITGLKTNCISVLKMK